MIVWEKRFSFEMPSLHCSRNCYSLMFNCCCLSLQDYCKQDERPSSLTFLLKHFHFVPSNARLEYEIYLRERKFFYLFLWKLFFFRFLWKRKSKAKHNEHSAVLSEEFSFSSHTSLLLFHGTSIDNPQTAGKNTEIRPQSNPKVSLSFLPATDPLPSGYNPQERRWGAGKWLITLSPEGNIKVSASCFIFGYRLQQMPS